VRSAVQVLNQRSEPVMTVTATNFFLRRESSAPRIS
jgi:hypothetical protein